MKDLIETLVAETQWAQCYRKRRTEFALGSASAADMSRFVASANWVEFDRFRPRATSCLRHLASNKPWGAKHLGCRYRIRYVRRNANAAAKCSCPPVSSTSPWLTIKRRPSLGPGQTGRLQLLRASNGRWPSLLPGNPAGGPVGSRHGQQLNGEFIAALLRDFRHGGPAAIAKVRKNQPAAY